MPGRITINKQLFQICFQKSQEKTGRKKKQVENKARKEAAIIKEKESQGK